MNENSESTLAHQDKSKGIFNKNKTEYWAII